MSKSQKINMYLTHITNKTLIKEIQKEFNAVYPYLWIEFFNIPYRGVGLFSLAEKVNHEKAVNELGDMDHEITIDINKNRTVAEVKKDIRKNLGLDVQILRKSGNVWVGTFLTEDWTLERQNFEGAQINMNGRD